MAETTTPALATDETSTKASSPTPIFGSSSTFGAASGFGGFKGVAAEPSKLSGATAPAEGDGEEGEDGGGDEDCGAEFKPLVQLDEVEVQTGEEAEKALVDMKCKLYRFDPESSEWKERGIGQVRLLEHLENHKVRLLMRQEKTLKIRANHIVMPGTKMQEHSGSEKSVVWSAVDFADEEQRTEMFCMRFASPERAQEFMAKHAEAMDHNDKLLAADEAEGGEAPATADPPSTTEGKPSAAADQLADDVGSGLKVADDSKDAAAAATDEQ